MNEEQKHAFAMRCAVAFPCLGEGAHSKPKPVASKGANSGTIADGPVTEHVPAPSVLPPADEATVRFGKRFVVPSGPIDDVGDIHF